MFQSTDGGISFVDDASALLRKPGLHPKEVREVLETSKLILSGSKPLLVDDELGDYTTLYVLGIITIQEGGFPINSENLRETLAH